MGDDWVVCMKRELGNSYDLESISPSYIFRVPSPLYYVRPAAFTPRTVTIGPYHRRLQQSESKYPFSEMEKYKIIAAKAIARTFENEDFGLLIEEIVRDENLVRTSFDTGLSLEDLNIEQLGYMFALDSAFVVAILHSFHNEHVGGRHSYLTKAKAELASHFSPVYLHRFSFPVRNTIIQDFLLLENQIPFFLLKKVIRMDRRCTSDEESEKRLEGFVGAVACRTLPFTKSEDTIAQGIQGLGKRGRHLLDCLYTIVTYQSKDAESSKEMDTDPAVVPSATQLHNAGVKFRGHDRSLMDISFERATLTIPRIHVGDDTERIFRNLVAYESQMMDKVDVISYLHFMNFLINTPEDVELLVEQGIVSQTIGSNKHVAEMWNELCTNTVCVFSKRYSEVARDAKEYVDLKIHGVLAELRERYFSRPWLVLSLLSGIALLVMTYLTMWYTILVYRQGG